MYKLKNGNLIRTSDGAAMATFHRTPDQYNQDDRDYFAWLNQGNIALEISEQKSPEEHFNSLRIKRDAKLTETDFSQLADSPFSSEEKLQYRNYRTYLRNLPLQYNNESVANFEVKTFEEWSA